MSEREILPCPFCNGESFIHATDETAYVECIDCDSTGPFAYAVADAIERWNAAPRTHDAETGMGREEGDSAQEILDRDRRIEFLLVQHRDFRNTIEKQKRQLATANEQIERLQAECNGEREAKEVYKRGEDLLFGHLAAEQRRKGER